MSSYFDLRHYYNKRAIFDSGFFLPVILRVVQFLLITSEVEYNYAIKVTSDLPRLSLLHYECYIDNITCHVCRYSS
jgi:hypothetical protein